MAREVHCRHVVRLAQGGGDDRELVLPAAWLQGQLRPRELQELARGLQGGIEGECCEMMGVNEGTYSPHSGLQTRLT